MNKVYVVTGFFRAVSNKKARILTIQTKTLKAFDTVAKAAEYITHENPLKLMYLFPMYNEKWGEDWQVDTDASEVSEDRLTAWHRLVSKTGASKHWIVILDVHEMEVE